MLVLLTATLLLALIAYYEYKKSTKGRLPLPPGPPSDPLIGHVRVMPTKDQHEVFYQWGKRYGDVIYLTVFGKSIVVLSSEEAARDLLEKRSANYSSRPEVPLMKEIGWNDLLGFVSSGDFFQKQRRMILEPFTSKKVGLYKDTQEEEAIVLLQALLNTPDDFDRHLHRYSAAIILKISEQFFVVMGGLAKPSLLDISPLFAKLPLPRWFPGAWHIKYIEESKSTIEDMMNYPLNLAREQMARGEAQPSITSAFIERHAPEGDLGHEDLHLLKTATHQIFGGAGETTWHTLVIFLACLVLYPEAQRKAQAEIDRVVGTERLPDFTDRASLPFIDCLLQETLRWHPVAPLGLPHESIEDDEYRGMRVPAGTTVIANLRAMTLDETKFSNPHSFNPERFMPKPEGLGEVLPKSIIFGWGRRVCPGRHFADTTAWLAIACILATFDVLQPLDAEGNPFKPEITFTTAVTSHPKPFPCRLTPRSERSARLITETFQHVSQAMNTP